jgi:hypothetical protein
MGIPLSRFLGRPTNLADVDCRPSPASGIRCSKTAGLSWYHEKVVETADFVLPAGESAQTADLIVPAREGLVISLNREVILPAGHPAAQPEPNRYPLAFSLGDR